MTIYKESEIIANLLDEADELKTRDYITLIKRGKKRYLIIVIPMVNNKPKKGVKTK